MPVSPQILLPLEGRRADRFEDFVPGSNGPLIAVLQELLAGKSGCVFLRGPEGSGKTHVLNAVCHAAQNRGHAAFFINPGRLPDPAARSLAGLESFDVLCVDDIDVIAGNPVWEEALFHCFNRFRERCRRLVFSSTLPLASISFELPDLSSRLAWGVRLRLEPLDDEAKAEVLRRRARSLGIELPDAVRNYLLSRGSRNLAVLLDNLEAVRVEALAGKRRLTVPLVRQVLDG